MDINALREGHMEIMSDFSGQPYSKDKKVLACSSGVVISVVHGLSELTENGWI